jgi:hypothetical protein
MLFAFATPSFAWASAGERCAAAAGALLGSFDDAQRERAARPFIDSERRDWTYITGSKARKQGIALANLSDGQRVMAHRLLACGLSSRGYLKATGIMRLDDVVRENIGDIIFKPTGPVEIGKAFYWVTIFGNPGVDSETGAPWGWQFEGHHLGLNFTIVGDSIAFTPAFMGADPAEMKEGPLAGWRLLGAEQDRAFALLNSLNPEQRERAIVADEVPRSLFTRPGGREELTGYSGIRAGEMTPQQRQLLWLLLDEYVQNVEPSMADRIVGEILRKGSDQLHFAWMGPTEPGSAIYYRIHGPVILIEFDHAANIRSPKLEPDPNHIHSIMRVPGGDFGDDLLRLHYEESPHHRDPADQPD